jgi:hypothetical protein
VGIGKSLNPLGQFPAAGGKMGLFLGFGVNHHFRK